jgi:hypothetical protein
MNKDCSVEGNIDKKDKPACYTPNDETYPLCKGTIGKHCKQCCLYEDMAGEGGYRYE